MISVEKTAITNGVSTSTKLLLKNINTNDKILDYGCGKLRNTKYLIDNGCNVTIYDTEVQLKNIQNLIPENVPILNKDEMFDKILCSFVLNVIPDIEERISLINNIYSLSNGIVYFEVRKENFEKCSKTAKPFNDGFILGKGKVKTFQKSFTAEELSTFIMENSNFKILEKINLSNSAIVICVNNQPLVEVVA